MTVSHQTWSLLPGGSASALMVLSLSSTFSGSARGNAMTLPAIARLVFMGPSLSAGVALGLQARLGPAVFVSAFDRRSIRSLAPNIGRIVLVSRGKRDAAVHGLAQLCAFGVAAGLQKDQRKLTSKLKVGGSNPSGVANPINHLRENLQPQKPQKTGWGCAGVASQNGNSRPCAQRIKKSARRVREPAGEWCRAREGRGLFGLGYLKTVPWLPATQCCSSPLTSFSSLEI